MGKGRGTGVNGSTPGQRKRGALAVLVTLPLKQALLSQEQLWHPFIGLQHYRTSRHKLSPISHVRTEEKARQEEGSHILV